MDCESWTWNSIDTKIVQILKKMCKKLPVLKLSNKQDDLIVETNASNEHWSAILKIKKVEKLCKYCSGSFNKAECNYPTMERTFL